MSKSISVMAPTNPYRKSEDATWGAVLGSQLGRAPRRSDTEDGPGLMGGDIDRIARSHHADGYAMAEREYEKKLEAAQAALADAYDEGYAAGMVERTRSMARDVKGRLLGLHFALMNVERGPKSKVAAGLPAVRAEFESAAEFVDAIAHNEAAAVTVVMRDGLAGA